MKPYRTYFHDQNAWWKPVITDDRPPGVGEEIFLWCPTDDEERWEGYGYLVTVTKVSQLLDGGWLVRHNFREQND